MIFFFWWLFWQILGFLKKSCFKENYGKGEVPYIGWDKSQHTIQIFNVIIKFASQMFGEIENTFKKSDFVHFEHYNLHIFDKSRLWIFAAFTNLCSTWSLLKQMHSQVEENLLLYLVHKVTWQISHLMFRERNVQDKSHF